MDRYKFTFTFKLSGSYASSPASTATPPPIDTATPKAAACPSRPNRVPAQLRYGVKSGDESKKMRIPRECSPSEGPTTTFENHSPEQMLAMTSPELRASRTFAAFREYVREFLFWVVVDDDDPLEVAAYDRFINNHNPTLKEDLGDDDLEFLFRHVTPRPQGIDFESDTNIIVSSARRLRKQCHGELATKRAVSPSFSCSLLCSSFMTMSSGPAPIDNDSQRTDDKLEMKRRCARERMAKRRAAVKALPLPVQNELRDRARESRAKYREQHRVMLLQKERARRQQKSRHTVEEYLRLRRLRESRPSRRNYQRQGQAGDVLRPGAPPDALRSGAAPTPTPFPVFV
ncbi:hypothetical protein DFH06DRAFT_1339902 [Mycena polygramma]|nr:hypothetical protein DFH06DRAFT_1339902 [Mycena polygramma]